MITDENLLLQNGAFYEQYPAKAIIFQSGNMRNYKRSSIIGKDQPIYLLIIYCMFRYSNFYTF
ncbi:hypothetical protein DBR39_12755 [Chryseobacterium sp. KBW03]|uniref:hypothetical protein n=1 Tax=Chryseobacterium sp. KBW03 TaxID=2153362 RepID=UPI000F59FA9B|nr:hypothetical protein [Chryseobacterium sp. KBW03]RQO37754.1 hypothetical protein DBR39_12755 [Chryseobacterium sp. KBW03]